eukprot:COSAG04_NODE_32463_length_251_cov_0.578947_1_plen_50_part_01
MRRSTIRVAAIAPAVAIPCHAGAVRTIRSERIRKEYIVAVYIYYRLMIVP